MVTSRKRSAFGSIILFGAAIALVLLGVSGRNPAILRLGMVPRLERWITLNPLPRQWNGVPGGGLPSPSALPPHQGRLPRSAERFTRHVV
jgi:hypothetical protein